MPLVTRVCEKAIADAGITKDQIGKLVIVSSTGFLGPGLDCELIKTLGLWRGVDRSLIGFMGCAAAMNGFRVANDYAVLLQGRTTFKFRQKGRFRSLRVGASGVL